VIRREDAERAKPIRLSDEPLGLQPRLTRVETSRRRVAVLAVHGIGEQVPFETLELVARGLCAADGHPNPTITATNVAFDSTHTAQRLDVVIHDREDKEVDVHLYEAYWASLTEGAVKLHDVFRFLVRGVWRSLFAAHRPFYRWAFHQVIDFGKQRAAFWGLLSLTLLLFNLAILNIVVPMIAATVLLRRQAPFGIPDLFVTAATLAFDVLLLTGGFALMSLWLAFWLKRDHPGLTFARSIGQTVGLVLLVIASLWLIVLPESLVILWFLHPFTSQTLRSSIFSAFVTPLGIVAAWAILLLVTWAVRYFFVEYLGDIVAYVNPQALDRFAELRQKIKSSVADVARLILAYKAGESAWCYDSVAIVGHSLGSVIAYDAINELLVDDSLNVSDLKTRDRVRTLITFGSPLDKTAFVFGLHGKDTKDLREKLAARVQPLIESYDNRKRLTWWNIFSPLDPISGRLVFYDTVENQEYPVNNVRDPNARIPLAAHLEYWSNTCVWTKLRESL